MQTELRPLLIFQAKASKTEKWDLVNMLSNQSVFRKMEISEHSHRLINFEKYPPTDLVYIC